jgi:hypothetical protein
MPHGLLSGTEKIAAPARTLPQVNPFSGNADRVRPLRCRSPGRFGPAGARQRREADRATGADRRRSAHVLLRTRYTRMLEHRARMIGRARDGRTTSQAVAARAWRRGRPYRRGDSACPLPGGGQVGMPLLSAEATLPRVREMATDRAALGRPTDRERQRKATPLSLSRRPRFGPCRPAGRRGGVGTD